MGGNTIGGSEEYIDIELPNDLCLVLFSECARRDMTPNQLIVDLIQSHILLQETEGEPDCA